MIFTLLHETFGAFKVKSMSFNYFLQIKPAKYGFSPGEINLNP